MAIEKKSAGPALQRPQPTSFSNSQASESTSAGAQAAAGSAPTFDRAAESLSIPQAGMLANRWVQQYTAAPDLTREQTEVTTVDAGSAKIEEKKTKRKAKPKKPSQLKKPKRS